MATIDSYFRALYPIWAVMSILQSQPSSGPYPGREETDGEVMPSGGGITVIDEVQVSADVTELALHADDRLRQHIESTHAQMRKYARDLNEVVRRERAKSLALEDANRQLRAFAEQLQASIDREQQRARDLEDAYMEMVRRLMNASAYKDRETGEHIQRLGHYSRALALDVGLTECEANMLLTAAPMHDLGKIGIPDRVLYKEGPLNAEEWGIMKQHPEIGARLLEGSKSPLIELARIIALGHHERWDGTGYPRGLKGDEIPMAARIVAIADCYDALRSRRPYKPALTHERACEIIIHGDGRTAPEHFDPLVLEAFVHVRKQFVEIWDSIRDPEEMAWDK